MSLVIYRLRCQVNNFIGLCNLILCIYWAGIEKNSSIIKLPYIITHFSLTHNGYQSRSTTRELLD
jgi:hypothetical protein